MGHGKQHEGREPAARRRCHETAGSYLATVHSTRTTLGGHLGTARNTSHSESRYTLASKAARLPQAGTGLCIFSPDAGDAAQPPAFFRRPHVAQVKPGTFDRHITTNLLHPPTVLGVLSGESRSLLFIYLFIFKSVCAMLLDCFALGKMVINCFQALLFREGAPFLTPEHTQAQELDLSVTCQSDKPPFPKAGKTHGNENVKSFGTECKVGSVLK